MSEQMEPWDAVVRIRQGDAVVPMTLREYTDGLVAEIRTLHKEVAEQRHNSTDCRTPDGITVNLIDSVITICRLLRDRSIEAPAVRDAVSDLRSDPDVRAVMLGPS